MLAAREAERMTEDIALKAFGFGLLSAASLPLGALAARFWSPGNRVIAAMMAFGGGALLAALTLDLVGAALERGHFYTLAAGSLLGGLLFVVFNQALNTQGGFLRKVGTTVNHLKRGRSREFKRVFRRLSRSPVFIALPPRQVSALIPHFQRRDYADGSALIRKGEPGDSLYIIDRGTVEVIDEAGNGHVIATLGADDVVGEMALVTGEARTATVRAKGAVKVWALHRKPFDRLVAGLPEFAQALHELARTRLSELQNRNLQVPEAAERWFNQASAQIDDAITLPSQADVQKAAAAHSAAPLAIWLGILLDGIPESFVIGSSAVQAHVSLSLIAGLFLSNFPEAFSSSLGMREQRYSHTRIITMWTSLMLITGVGAWLGSRFFAGANPVSFSLVEGIAAGAMLTVIAETMLPEAYHRGGAITGFSTLLGFLAAVFFSTLE